MKGSFSKAVSLSIASLLMHTFCLADWSNIDLMPEFVPVVQENPIEPEEAEISTYVPPGQCMDSGSDAACHKTPTVPDLYKKPVREKTLPSALRFDVGSQWNYVHVTSPGLPTYHGQSWGVHGDISYSRPWSLFADASFFWNHSFIRASSIKKRSLEEVDFEGILGYSFGFAKDDRAKVTPFVGLEYNKLSDHRSNDLFIPNIRLYYYTIFIPFGFSLDYLAAKWFEASFRFTAMPSINQRLLIPTLPDVNWLLDDRYSFRVDLPLRFIVAHPYNKYQLDIRLTPSYRFIAIGQASVLSLPKRNFSYYSILLDLGYSF